MSTKTANRRRKAQVTEELSNGMALWGEVITWTAPRGGTSQAELVQALKDAGLDEGVAKDLTPQAAFTRACKQMEEDRSIDSMPKDGEWLRFQFTKKALASEASEGFEVQFKKESVVRVNGLTGEVKCKNATLKELAEAKLKHALAHRNGSDVTNIVTKLFEKQLHELVHVDAGVYFVPAEFAPFTAQVDVFLRKVGGAVNRFPVPKGTQVGDQSVQDAVARHFEGLVQDHKNAVGLLTVFSRQGALDVAAEKINETRVKVEAYAQYLSDRRGDLLKALDDASEELRVQVEQISQAKETRKAEANGDAGGRDRFGTRLGTRQALINSVIDATPKTHDDILKEIGGGHTFYNHLKALAEKGFVVKTPDGRYRRVKKEDAA